MDKRSARELARMVVREFCSSHRSALSAETQHALGAAIETAISAVESRERAACTALCEERATLWAQTADKRDTLPALRTEALARYKEATYVADAIRSRSPSR